MAQSDQVIQNATFPAVRADINDNLAALYSQSSGNTAPTTTVAFQTWVDTSSSPAVWKIRDATNTGWITIGKIDSASSIGGFESGTQMIFVQTNAPLGWTKDTTHNNKSLRVVSGVAGSGGTTAFTSVFASRTPAGTVGSTTLTTSQIPSHTHGLLRGSTLDSVGSRYAASTFNNGTTNSNAEGGGGSHNHSFTGTAMDFDVQYVDVIIATKD